MTTPEPDGNHVLHQHLNCILQAALAAVDARRAVQRALRLKSDVLHLADAAVVPPNGVERIYVVAAGKAAWPGQLTM